MTTDFKIFDTGDAGALTKTTALPVNRRAGFDGATGVNPFELKFTTYTMNGGGSILEEPALINNDELNRLSRVSAVTYKNPVIVLNCILEKDNVPETGFDVDWFYQLIGLERTKGVKLLYITAPASRYPTMLERYSKKYLDGVWQPDINTLEGTSGQQYHYIPVIVKSIGNITDSADRSTIRFDMTLRVAGE